MDVIKADYVGMINSANSLSSNVYKLTNEIDRLKAVLNDIDIFWEGEANLEFHIALNMDFAVMEALCVKIRYSAKLLKEAVDEYVSVELMISRMIGGE